MAKGIIFDIKEMAVHDGPGPRTTVFFKGCPLRCKWCHNPEGLLFSPQLMVKTASCIHCGRCYQPCGHLECKPYGRCIHACPKGLISVSGTEMDAETLAFHLLKNADFLNRSGGGVTVSGGEPLAQPEFLMDLLSRLSSVHRAIETSGYAESEIFLAAISYLDYIIMDMKHTDSKIHQAYTGVDNAPILKNLELLKLSGKPFIIRIPLISGVNDTFQNLSQTARLLQNTKNLIRVELLPYNILAGAKYPMVGLDYPNLDLTSKEELNLSAFKVYGVPVILA